MVIQPIKQLEAEYMTVTKIYDVMLFVKDKFYGLK
jgi:hypothetical protein